MASDSILDQSDERGRPSRDRAELAVEPATAAPPGAETIGSPAPVLPAAEPGQRLDGPEPVVIPPNEPQTVVSARFGDDERVNVASQWTLMWWKFRKHRLALISAWVVIGLYLTTVLVEPIAPYDPEQQDVR